MAVLFAAQAARNSAPCYAVLPLIRLRRRHLWEKDAVGTAPVRVVRVVVVDIAGGVDVPDTDSQSHDSRTAGAHFAFSLHPVCCSQ